MAIGAWIPTYGPGGYQYGCAHKPPSTCFALRWQAGEGAFVAIEEHASNNHGHLVPFYWSADEPPDVRSWSESCLLASKPLPRWIWPTVTKPWMFWIVEVGYPWLSQLCPCPGFGTNFRMGSADGLDPSGSSCILEFGNMPSGANFSEIFGDWGQQVFFSTKGQNPSLYMEEFRTLTLPWLDHSFKDHTKVWASALSVASGVPSAAAAAFFCRVGSVAGSVPRGFHDDPLGAKHVAWLRAGYAMGDTSHGMCPGNSRK